MSSIGIGIVGVGKAGALRRTDAQMIEPVGVALQTADDLPQARGARQLGVQHRHKLALGRQPTDMLVRPVLVDQLVEAMPWNTLQKIMQNAIVMRHGVGPFSCPKRRQTIGDE